jgi:hypothetical protein
MMNFQEITLAIAIRLSHLALVDLRDSTSQTGSTSQGQIRPGSEITKLSAIPILASLFLVAIFVECYSPDVVIYISKCRSIELSPHSCLILPRSQIRTSRIINESAHLLQLVDYDLSLLM